MPQNEKVFLSAEWRDLVMLNYEIDPALLSKHVPPGTTLDSFAGKTYVSLVGFRFLRTKILGSISIPFHSNFDEVNLRFYVRRQEAAEQRRGVVFIAEIVPRQAVAKVARIVYGENYVALPMKHRIVAEGSHKSAEYEWQLNGRWCMLAAQSSSVPGLAPEGSVEQFITEHYWGYSTQRAGGGLEYHVTHEPWQVRTSTPATFEGNVSSLYGPELANVLKRPPDSAFIAEGSPVVVFKGKKIK